MKVEKFIPVGRENAISRAALSIRTGAQDRFNRKAIQEARDRGVPIVFCDDGSGYYIAQTSAEVRALQRNYLKRIFAMMDTINSLSATVHIMEQEEGVPDEQGNACPDDMPVFQERLAEIDSL